MKIDSSVSVSKPVMLVGLRDYLASKGIDVPAAVDKDPGGNLSFYVKDPEGHSVEFVQYLPGSIHSRNFGKQISDRRLSDHILHVGIRVVDPVRADKFYKDVLGFRLMWKGGRTDTHFDWISMLVPDGHDWVEYMVTETQPTPKELGVLHHYCLGTLDIQKAYKTVVERGYNPPRPPNIARDGRWLLQLYDDNLHSYGADGPQAGGNAMLLTDDGRSGSKRMKRHWRDLPVFAPQQAVSGRIIGDRSYEPGASGNRYPADVTQSSESIPAAVKWATAKADLRRLPILRRRGPP